MRYPLTAFSRLALLTREPYTFDDELIQGRVRTIKTIVIILAAKNENCFSFDTKYGSINND